MSAGKIARLQDWKIGRLQDCKIAGLIQGCKFAPNPPDSVKRSNEICDLVSHTEKKGALETAYPYFTPFSAVELRSNGIGPLMFAKS